MALSVLLLRAFLSFSSISSSSQLAIASVYALICFLYLAIIIRRKYWRHVFIVNFGCYTPAEEWRTPFSTFMEHSKLCGEFDEKSLEFQSKILERSGLSQLTALPKSLHYLPPRISTEEERSECETVLCGALEELFASSPHVKPSQIGVIVTNCSVFSPTPSMTSIIVHKYKLPVDVKSFNLAGMGCSAGILALDLAKRVLLAHPNKYALVLSTENLTRSWYYGNERSMLVTNCLFRVGGSAVLVSNNYGDRKHSKYRIMETMRSQVGASDGAYKCVYQEEDSKGIIGVGLSKDLMQCASMALEHNMKMLGPKVLPIWEIILYLSHGALKRFFPKEFKHMKAYIPDFKLAFDHICIHAGGKAVVRAMEESLKIPFELSEPSHMTLYRYGNLSSASVWYELAYVEAKGRVKKGHKVWQIGLGSGFKCCSSVLKAVKTIDPQSASSCWADCIQEMPVKVPTEEDHKQ